MRVVAAGRVEEVRGFALAGVETVWCDTASAAAALLTDLQGADPPIGLLIVSPWLAGAVPDRLQRLRERKGPPMVLTLPAGDGSAGDRP
jgi:vacuolar-type H+-ATPase subunit F/Vma7